MGGAREIDVAALAQRVLAGDRAALARAISLIESTSAAHFAAAERLLAEVLPRTGQAVRVGITGVPGAGKSTFIERLGLMLCERGTRVAVLAVDPSSGVSGGSILGDRTRMGRLAAHALAFIRPSPSGLSLGGVARRTREAGLVCEAAGFRVVLVETVGVGQSETVVADMVDCVLGLAVAGTGDELQGVKRGLLERVDVLAVNKADGENRAAAARAAAELAAALRVLRGGGESGSTPVLACSAATGEGVAEVWEQVERCVSAMRSDGRLAERRRGQLVAWMDALVQEQLAQMLASSNAAASSRERAIEQLRLGDLSPGQAAREVIEALTRELRASPS